MGFLGKRLALGVVVFSLFGIGYKLGSPDKNTGEGRPTASDVLKGAAVPKRQEVIYNAEVTKAARAYAAYADMFSVNKDGSLSAGLAALRDVTSRLHGHPHFRGVGLQDAYQRLEREARGLTAYAGGTLSSNSDVAITKSVHDAMMGYAVFTALEDLSLALHGGRSGDATKMAQAKRQFLEETKKHPSLAGLEFMVELAKLHIQYARNGAPAGTNYLEHVAEYEAKLAASRKGVTPAPALAAKAKEPPSKAVVTPAGTLTAIEASTRDTLLDGSVQGAINNVKIQLGQRFGVTSVDKEYTDLVTKFAHLNRNRQSPEALYDAAIGTRAVLLMLTAHPQYSTLNAGDRARTDRAFAAVEAYHKEARVLQTRCGGRTEIRTRGFRCGG